MVTYTWKKLRNIVRNKKNLLFIFTFAILLSIIAFTIFLNPKKGIEQKAPSNIELSQLIPIKKKDDINFDNTNLSPVLLKDLEKKSVNLTFQKDKYVYKTSNAQALYSNNSKVYIADLTFNQSNYSISLDNADKAAITKNKNEIRYSKIQTDTNIKYENFDQYIKETIEVLSQKAPTEFTFSLKTPPDIVLQLDNNKGIIGLKNSQPNIYIQPLFAYDSNGKAVKYEYEITKIDSGYSLKIKPSDLKALKNAVYPVYIDPTFSWNFTTNSQYTLSDSSLIEVAAEVLRLKDLGSGTYSQANPYAVTNNPINYTNITSFIETLGANNAGNIKYSLSPNNTSWYYYNGSFWSNSTDFSQTNTISEINTNISSYVSFHKNTNLYIKIYLNAPTTTSPVELDNLAVNYTSTAPVVSSITPNSGSTAGGDTVTITGQNFVPNYQLPISLSNPNTSTLSNFQVSLNVDTASLIASGHMKNDGSDIRFYDTDNSTAIPYWVESGINTSSTKIWLKISSIPAGTETIYMHYGDQTLSSQSNADNVFDFIDNFSGSSIDTSKWNVVDGTGFSVSGGTLNGTNTTGRLKSLSTFSSGEVLEIKAKTTTIATNGQMIGGFYISSSNSLGWLNHPGNAYYRNDSNWINKGDQTPTDNYLYTIKVKDASTANLSMYDLDTGSTYWNIGDVSNNVSTEPITLGTRYDDSYTGQSYATSWDYVRVRKYALNDPIVVPHSEVASSTVTIGGINLTNISVVDSQTITGQTGAHIAGTADISVTNPDSQSSTLASSYTFTTPPNPTITSLSSSSGISIGNDLITLTGTNFRNGKTYDGSIIVSSSKDINTDTISSGRTCADAINYSVTSLTDTSATLSSTPAAGCLSAGDEVLLINLQGTSTNYANAGNYDILTISSISGSTINFTNYKTRFYGDDGTDANIGTSSTNQKVMLQRVPNYKDVTINSGVTLTADAWNGTKGGVLYFKASGTVTNNGIIDMSGKGYKGGTNDNAGESYNGKNNNSINPNGGGGGMGIVSSSNVGGGGGASYGSLGTCAYNANNFCGTNAGKPGYTYGDSSLFRLNLGSGGGGGTYNNDTSTGTGGNGGGSITISAATVTNNGSILNKGTDGAYGDLQSYRGWGYDSGGAGGAGSGGSVLIKGGDTNISSSNINISGGTGGYGDYSGNSSGGNGGNGIKYLTSAESFSQGINVQFGNTDAKKIRFINSTTLNIYTPSHSSGTVDVKAINPDSTSVTSTNAFTFNPGPSITTITPNIGPNDNSNLTLTISGSNFQSGATIKLKSSFDSDINCTSPIITSTQISCSVNLTNHRTGVWDVYIQNSDTQSFTETSAFTVSNPAPSISSISPTAGLVSGGTNVSISGSNFRNPVLGIGSDGSITLSVNKNINTDNIASGRSCADAVNYSVTALTSNTATLSSSPAAGCLSSGDEILLINLQGTSTNFSNVGNYEILEVSSVSGSTVTFRDNKSKYYGDNSNDDTNIGTLTTNQRVMLQRVPHYKDVTINNGVTFTSNGWDSTKGGVMLFKASGTVINNGTIDLSGKGYHGGYGVNTQGNTNDTGETISGTASHSTLAYYGGGGGARLCGNSNTSGGGGGSYATSGSRGGREGGYCSRGEGAAYIYGDTQLSKLYFGSGGGSQWGGSNSYNAGGILNIYANSISNSGSILVNGQGPTGSNTDSSGSGAGGSIKLISNTVTNSGTISAIGAAGSSYYNGNVGTNQGKGGDGRIAILSSNSSNITGTTTPSYNYFSNTFDNLLSVKFGSTDSIFQYVSSASITATSPAHTKGAVSVTVTNPDTQTSSYNSYNYNDILSISSVSPSTGSYQGGNTVTISGTGFFGTPTVKFGQVNSSIVTLVNETTLNVVVPAVSYGQLVDISISQSDAQTTKLLRGYSYTGSNPTITDLSPDAGTTIGGNTVNINGGNFGKGGGNDGSITVSTNMNINTDAIAPGRTCADAVNYSVTALTSNTATLNSAPPSNCLSIGDEVLIINQLGTSTAKVNLGNHETLKIASISGSTLTFVSDKTKYYGDNNNDDTNIGTTTTNQRVMVQRIPNYRNVTINSGATLTATTWDGAKGGILYIKVSGNLTNNGSINLSVKGFGSTEGPGVGDRPVCGCSCGNSAAGGGYGGQGGYGNGSVGGFPYGNPTTPLNLGSGGNIADCGTGGTGGGSIYIFASGTITNTGTISSNGSAGGTAAGGASGGSINLDSNVITGAGTITANGGDGGDMNCFYCQRYGGSGSGGRISIKYRTTNSLSGTVTANTGASGGNVGENGTLFYINSTTNDLSVETSQTWRPNVEGPTISFHSITIKNNSTITVPGVYTNNSNGYGLILDVTDFDLQSGSTINMNGLGYAGSASNWTQGSGPGGGPGNNCGGGNSAAGAGYGGVGGSGNGPQGGITYGSDVSPVDLGSGGGGSCGAGGNGGGALKVNGRGLVKVNGTITANGNGGGTMAGGGSGGSIWILGSTIQGAGTLNANGGDGGDWAGNRWGGGGGGGRISLIYATANTFSGTINVNAGTSHYTMPSNGTTNSSINAINTSSQQYYYINEILPSLKLYVDNTLVTTDVIVLNATQIRYTAPAHAYGVVDIKVVNPDTLNTTKTSGYFYNNNLDVNAISPTNGPKAGGNTVTILGSNFYGTPIVEFGNTNASSVQTISPTTLKVVAPSSTDLETVDVRISQNDGQTLTLPQAYSFVNSAPVISSVSPNSGFTNSTTNVTINGSNFFPDDYERQITVTNSSGSNLTDYQINIDLDTASLISALKLKSDGSDIRFFDTDNTTTLSYWIESGLNTAHTKIWVKIPQINASSTKTIYLQYGKPGNTPQSSISNTFIREISGLQESLNFDETIGSTANDRSGNSNNGIATGTTIVDGKFGNARSFNGSSDYVSVSNSTNLDMSNKPFTIEAWVYKNANFGNGGYKRIVDKVKVGGPDGYAIDMADDNLRLLGATNLTVPFNSSINTWYHVVGISDGNGTGYIYINNQLIGSGAYTSTTPFSSPLIIGADSNYGSLFNGIIDEVKVYNVALSSTEINDIYNNYNYVSLNDSNKSLVRKYTIPEPSNTIGSETNGSISVKVGGVNATNIVVINPTSITATFPTRINTGAIDVVVTTQDTQSSTLSGGFNYSPASIEFTNPSLNIMGNEPGTLTIRQMDNSNNPLTTTSPITLSLSSTSNTGSFAVDLNETESTRWTHNTATISAGQNSATFYYKDSSKGTPTITVHSTLGNLTPETTQNESIKSKYKLEITNVPSAIKSGNPISPVVSAVDYANNVLTDYTGKIHFTSTDTNAVLPDDFKYDTAMNGEYTFTNRIVLITQGSKCLTATDLNDNDIAGSICNINVTTPNVGTISNLKFITTPPNISENSTSDVITVQTQDASGRPIPVNSDTTITLSLNKLTGQFSTNPQALNWENTQSYTITIKQGSTVGNLFIKSLISEIYTLTASSQNLTSDTMSFNVGGFSNTVTPIPSSPQSNRNLEIISTTTPENLLITETIEPSNTVEPVVTTPISDNTNNHLTKNRTDSSNCNSKPDSIFCGKSLEQITQIKIPEPVVKASEVTEKAAVAITGVIAVSPLFVGMTNYNLILSTFSIILGSKKRRSNGIVYDLETNKPIPFAIVKLMDFNTNKFIKDTVTDTQGRFSFIIDKGNYYFQVSANGYNGIQSKNPNSLSSDIYNGENIKVDFDNANISLKMPLSKEKISILTSIKMILKKYLPHILNIIVWIMLPVSAILFYSNSSILNLIPLILYGYLFIQILYFKTINKSAPGILYDIDTNKRLKGVFIKLLNSRNLQQSDDLILSDDKGRFLLLPEEGNFILQLEANGYFVKRSNKGIIKNENSIQVNNEQIKDINIGFKKYK